MIKVLLGITGGIAAYKSAELLRLLKLAGFDVRVVMTKSAQTFIAPLTFQALSAHKVYTDLFDADDDTGMDHIQLARWADLILVAPASADFIARLAHGNANDLLSTLCLATTAPIAVAPAMNQQMWLHVATQENLATLNQRKVLCFGPGVGDQACREVGPGRLLEPSELLEKVQAQFRIDALVGKNLLITAGPTQEPIDPIRYLSNRSTGMMGYTLAEMANYAGAHVTVISGPTHLSLSRDIEKLSVNTALEMQQMVMSRIATTDIFIAAAAVSDYRPQTSAPQKIKKSEDDMVMHLVRNPDILAEVTALKKPPFSVGFAAETQDLLNNAKSKVIEKKLDMIIANRVGEAKGFGDCPAIVTVLTKAGERLELSSPSKSTLAKQLIQEIAKNYQSLLA